MADKFSLVGSSQSYLTIKQLAHGSARTKGNPEIVAGLFMFPFDDYASGDDQLLIYEAERVEVVGQADGQVDSSQFADVNIALGDKLYWDAANSVITNVAAGHRFVGRALEAKDFSGGAAATDTLLMTLEPPAGFRVHCGTGTLDGSNPTSITHGLGTCLAFTATLVKTSAPGVGTSVLTANINGAAVDVYAWKPTSNSDPTLVASTGTEQFYWIAVGS
jgi:hypothetical protein